MTYSKREAKMLPDHAWLAKFPMCGGLSWVDEALMVEIGFDAVKGKVQVKAPSEKEMLDFLAGPALPKDKQVYLRMRVWWAANEVWRWLPNPKQNFSKDQVQNLKSLSDMLDEKEPNQRILKAEIARELGNFDECLGLLSYHFDERYWYAVGFIKKLAEDKVRVVRSISPGK